MEWETFADFTAKLAAELGLQVDPGRMWTWCLFLVSYTGDGTGYSVTLPKEDGKTTVTPLYPPSRTWKVPAAGRERQARISVSRGPHTVAVEIMRRLGATYRADLRAIAASNATADARQAAREELAARLGRMFGDTCRPRHMQSDYTTTVMVHGPDCDGGELRFSGNASVIEFRRFRLPAGVAMEMLAVYAAALAGGEDREEARGLEHDHPGEVR